MNRISLTQEQYRKQQRNERWIKTAIIAIPMMFAIVSCASAVYMWWSHGYR